MLPEGVRSIAEIEEYREARDRFTFYAGLLEYLLKSITPDSEFTKFVDLITPVQFPMRQQLRLVHQAREVWNELHHANPRVTPGQVLHAEVTFREAIDEILPRCSKPVQNDARGEEDIQPEESHKKLTLPIDRSVQPRQPAVGFGKASSPPHERSDALKKIMARNARRLANRPYNLEDDPTIMAGIGKDHFTPEQLDAYYRVGLGGLECPLCSEIIDFHRDTAVEGQRLRCNHCGAKLMYAQGQIVNAD
jgi:DNA-directed RNA polymerase subunit RPC12/RpoP